MQKPNRKSLNLVKRLEEGYDLVIGAYTSKRHSTLRNWSGKIIDFMQRRIFKLPNHFQLTSFRAVRATVVKQVNQMSNAFPYITAMLLVNASKCTNIIVQHEPRRFGASNYDLKRSLFLAINLIFSYSPYPIYCVVSICIFAFLFGFGYGFWAIVKALQLGTGVPGWASTVVIMSFFNGLIMVCLLIFGIYILRVHQQSTRVKTSYKIDEIHE